MKYKIVVDKQSRTNPSTEKREYIIDIEELRCKGNVYDSLKITKDEDYVIRRLSLSEYNVLNVLEEPIKEPLDNLNIKLFEGDNYIYLIDMVGNKFHAEYIINNEFNDMYITKSEAHSAISQAAKGIEISVDQKLTNINGEIEDINAKLEAKIDKDDDGQIISMINASADEINISGNRLVIDARNLKVTKNGELTCTDATIKGHIESASGEIGGWAINSEGLSNGKVFIKNDGASTIYTVADLIIIREYIMGNSTFNLPQSMIQHYDFNGDGKVTASDYVTLQNLIGINMN